MSYELEARCPCCQSALQAKVTVRCEGHDVHEVGLELAVAAESTLVDLQGEPTGAWRLCADPACPGKGSMPHYHPRPVALEGEPPAWLRRLENLTPGGSEYVGNPGACVTALERRIKSLESRLAQPTGQKAEELSTWCNSLSSNGAYGCRLLRGHVGLCRNPSGNITWCGHCGLPEGAHRQDCCRPEPGAQRGQPGTVALHCWTCGWTMRHLAPLGVQDLIEGHLVACPGPVDSLCGRTRYLHERGQEPIMLREADRWTC